MQRVQAAYPKEVAASVLAATLAAAAMIAQQVIGKATRDALFLSHHSVTRLPLAMIAGVIVSGVVVVVMTRMIRRWGPARVVPAAFMLHAVAMLLEWLAAKRFEPQVALVVYVHTASVGATILSAFWSVVSESFDPHTAKQVVGRIGAGAALGGVVGGGLAWVGSRVTGIPTMLLAMAFLSLACAAGVRAIGKNSPDDRVSLLPEAGVTTPTPSGLRTLRRTPYLRMLAMLVLLSALTQALLDYLLSAQATQTYGHGARLLSFFALFQTAVGVVSLLLQLSVNRLALERLGVSTTIALMPSGVVVFGVLALGAPSLVTAALQRGAEGVLGGSLFRSAYEILFTPLPQSLKRPTKTAIDVVFDRLGMMAGSALTLVLIAWSAHGGMRAVTITATTAAAVQVLLAHRLHRAYVATLAERLRSGAVELDSRDVHDRTTLATLSRTLDDLDRRPLLAQIEALRASKDERDAGVPEVLQMLATLARDDPTEEAREALRAVVPRHIGAIVDVVLDGSRPVSTRRRAARLLSGLWSQRAADALGYGLDATELDVRYTCGHVLVGMRERNPALHFDSALAIARARRELQNPAAFDRRRVEHAFNVLALTFPREPMQLAYAALTADDPYLRGVALEYLDATLPADLREALSLHLEIAPMPAATTPVMSPAAAPRPLEHLLQSRDALRITIDELHRQEGPSADRSR
ncbi:MAG: putative rane protein [Myxococcaceae bacterium]|nr:putative rane protein [Myxococcaceae bacterium]